MKQITIVDKLSLDTLSADVTHRLRVVVTDNATGNESQIPVLVRKSEKPGPVLGITAALHGNELNGIPVIHRLLSWLEDRPLLCGTVIAVPIVNIPGYLRKQREFEDGQDLNRLMPGNPHGHESELYAARFVDRIASHFDYLIDLHTASFGRVNSLYVRADMEDPVATRLARLIGPQIILHSPGKDGTLRAAMAERGVHSITVEVGDPQRLQQGLVRTARLGVIEILEDLKMVDSGIPHEDGDCVECSSSYWMYTDRGGILQVTPEVAQMVRKDQEVARLRNVWGELVRTYLAPEDGIVIGKSTDPAARAGSRILHLGVLSGK